MKRILFFLLFLVQSSLVFSDSNDPIQNLSKRVIEQTLPNGLKILILERDQAPLVSFQMMFKTGGVDEISGKTGLAHLFEHMLFKGTKTIGTKDYDKEKTVLEEIDKTALEILEAESDAEKLNLDKIKALKKKMEALETEHQKWVIPEEYDQIYIRHGAEGLNAFTGKDMTGFVVSLPSNKWELYFLMESERMKNPVLREFYKERDVVMEERRMRYETAPQGALWENFISLAFKAHPYASPTIGWSSDIKNLTLRDARRFFSEHYVSNNATVVIVGDVRAKEVLEKFNAYFSSLSSGTLPSSYKTVEPPQSGEKRSLVNFDAEPSLLLGFKKPNPPHPDNFVMEMIEQLLSRGRSSRFYRNIVEKKIALSVWASNGNPGERYSNLIVFGGSPRKPFKNKDLEIAILQELDRLKKEKVSEQELEKIRNQIEADFIRNLSSNSGMASQLAYNQVVLGDWKYLFQYLKKMRQVTPEELQASAQKYFVEDSKTVTFLERKSLKLP